MITLTFTFDPSLIDIRVLVMSVLGYFVVLLALSAMAFIMVRFHLLRDHLRTRKLKNSSHAETVTSVKPVMTGEENAAIAAALYLYFSELHDREKYVMTIKKVSRTYSPWSSKFYNIYNSMKHW
ncbi:MAG: hypothetical protein WCO02_17070 [Bacteroidota bacterium]